MSSAVVREMSSVSGESGVRAEIRKKQNRDSARRSREKRKTHLRGVYESVEQQSKRVRELDARVAFLEQLVNREVKPRRRNPAPKTRAPVVEEQRVELPASALTTPPQESLTPPPPPPPPPPQQQQQRQQQHALTQIHPSLAGSVHQPELAPVPLVEVHEHPHEHHLDIDAAFDPASHDANLSYPLQISSVQTGEIAESVGPAQVDPWQADAPLPDPTLDAECPLEGFIGGL